MGSRVPAHYTETCLSQAGGEILISSYGTPSPGEAKVKAKGRVNGFPRCDMDLDTSPSFLITFMPSLLLDFLPTFTNMHFMSNNDELNNGQGVNRMTTNGTISFTKMYPPLIWDIIFFVRLYYKNRYFLDYLKICNRGFILAMLVWLL